MLLPSFCLSRRHVASCRSLVAGILRRAPAASIHTESGLIAPSAFWPFCLTSSDYLAIRTAHWRPLGRAIRFLFDWRRMDLGARAGPRSEEETK